MVAPDDAPAPEKLPPRYREVAGLLLDVEPSMLKGFTMRSTRPDGTPLALKQLFAALATQPQPHPRGRVSHRRDEDGVVRRHVAQLQAPDAPPLDPAHDLTGVLVVAELPDDIEPPKPVRRKVKRTVEMVDTDGTTIEVVDGRTDKAQARREVTRVGRGRVHRPTDKPRRERTPEEQAEFDAEWADLWPTGPVNPEEPKPFD